MCVLFVCENDIQFDSACLMCTHNLVSFQSATFLMLVKWWGCVTLFYRGMLRAVIRVALWGYWPDSGKAS